MNLDKCFSNFQNVLSDIQTNLSALAHNNPHARPPFHNALSALHRAFQGPTLSPPWARVAQSIMPMPRQPMSWEAIEERLEGVPVYALSNASEEFLLVAGVSTGKNLGLFCFNEDDAQALLRQVSTVDPRMRDGSKVVPVALNKVFQLKVNGVAFRLIPEQSQVKNALRVREKSGFAANSFPGVPVFQSKSLILKSQDKRYRPLFFRKEDLEKSLHRASSDQNQLNPTLRQGDIQVATLEDVIKQMKENSTSKWEDVVFIPPGFDVSTDPRKQRTP
ncbi:hypothetical protein HN51_038446 [Arachis hypogaea]|uniref:Protein TIC 22-like, chloroplastic n=1 Tax=Arachis duranensis TaxID=130453 RepID=A0A6P4CYA6_ARADU|nr:protein TIC 22-like, chloroplastic [Arachis duranensis]XP_015958248.1 protein TIC 22-like, chloroplastic [Arachis duranensis]XP_025691725.1 protein TIC 22-like, chloroplastic [Arachis hypogaea]XP_025691726.1 protein TIC 22-like, chloroplastic [Arachis hypogaea]QHO04173.1 Protein TIC 22-like [Arachis hypogaea]QHO04174.1 Protein TIC 22-like [Arachis hypogaea]